MPPSLKVPAELPEAAEEAALLAVLLAVEPLVVLDAVLLEEPEQPAIRLTHMAAAKALARNFFIRSFLLI
jgi:hypothetical protein